MFHNGLVQMLSVALGDRIREVRNMAGLTQGALAERVGATRPAIAQYEVNRSKPPLAVLMKIADALDVRMEHLIDESKPVVEIRNVDPNAKVKFRPIPTVRVPIVGDVAAGAGEQNVDNIDPDEWIDLPVTILDPKDPVLAWRVKGDSMMPALEEGDLVVFRGGDTSPRRGRSYLLRKPDGSLMVKFLEFDSKAGEWVGCSINRSYGEIPLQGVQFLGKLIGYMRIVGTSTYTAYDTNGLILGS